MPPASRDLYNFCCLQLIRTDTQPLVTVIGRGFLFARLDFFRQIQHSATLKRREFFHKVVHSCGNWSLLFTLFSPSRYDWQMFFFPRNLFQWNFIYIPKNEKTRIWRCNPDGNLPGTTVVLPRSAKGSQCMIWSQGMQFKHLQTKRNLNKKKEYLMGAHLLQLQKECSSSQQVLTSFEWWRRRGKSHPKKNIWALHSWSLQFFPCKTPGFTHLSALFVARGATMVFLIQYVFGCEVFSLFWLNPKLLNSNWTQTHRFWNLVIGVLIHTFCSSHHPCQGVSTVSMFSWYLRKKKHKVFANLMHPITFIWHLIRISHCATHRMTVAGSKFHEILTAFTRDS